MEKELESSLRLKERVEPILGPGLQVTAEWGWGSGLDLSLLSYEASKERLPETRKS